MASNSFGTLFRMTSFGESHGLAMGVVIDACPAGVKFNQKLFEKNMQRRRPGNSPWVSSRQEDLSYEILSGIYEGQTLGTPIAIVVYNQDARSADYKEIQKGSFRQGHADDLWNDKFQQSDLRGGGRASGRETLSRVMAASVAQMFLSQACPSLNVRGLATQIGSFQLSNEEKDLFIKSHKLADEFPASFPSATKANQVVELLMRAKEEGKSYGGFVEIVIQNAPRGLGQPVFHKLKNDLASALMSIGAVSQVQIGREVDFSLEGTQFHQSNENYGGIRGGISTGEDIYLKVGVKPTSSVMDVAKKGRHDPCIIPRAIPVLEAMVNLVLADHVLWSRLDNI